MQGQRFTLSLPLVAVWCDGGRVRIDCPKLDRDGGPGPAAEQLVHIDTRRIAHTTGTALVVRVAGEIDLVTAALARPQCQPRPRAPTWSPSPRCLATPPILLSHRPLASHNTPMAASRHASGNVWITRHSSRIHVPRPSDVPQPVTHGWNAAWAYPSGFAPRSYPRCTPRRGRSLRTGPSTTPPTCSRTSFSERHCSQAASGRTAMVHEFFRCAPDNSPSRYHRARHRD